MEARPPVLKARVVLRVFQNAWTVCQIGRPVRSSVGDGRASCTVSRVSDRLKRALERRPVRDCRLAVLKNDSSVVGHLLLY